MADVAFEREPPLGRYLQRDADPRTSHRAHEHLRSNQIEMCSNLRAGLLIWLYLGCLLTLVCKSQPQVKSPSTAELVQNNLFRAIEHNVITSDGFILNVVEVQNPWLEGGYRKDLEPCLFLHGSLTTANIFIGPTENCSPRDLTYLHGANVTDSELALKLSEEPSGRSLPFTLSNMGYRVFLMNRRGCEYSLGHIDPSRKAFLDKEDIEHMNYYGTASRARSFNGLAYKILSEPGKLNKLVEASKLSYNQKYWTFSMDEQAEFDVPETIEYIVDKTGAKKVIIVGYSAGAALSLMSLSLKPELDAKSPTLYMGHARFPDLIDKIRPRIIAGLSNLAGPFIPIEVSQIIRRFIKNTCNTWLGRQLTCPKLYSALGGSTGDQIVYSEGLSESTIQYNSAHELAQSFQCNQRQKMHHFDFLDVEKNKQAYGQKYPPIYDVKKIPSEKIHIWCGGQDSLASLHDVRLLSRDLRIPNNRFHLIDGQDVTFSHISFVAHRNLTDLLVVPILRAILHRAAT